MLWSAKKSLSLSVYKFITEKVDVLRFVRNYRYIDVAYFPRQGDADKGVYQIKGQAGLQVQVRKMLGSINILLQI